MAKSITHNKGGRKIDYTAFFFLLNAHRHPAWYAIFLRFGHLGTAILLANCEYMCRARHFLLKLDTPFYAILERDHRITKEQYIEVLKYAISEGLLYDQILFEMGYLFSITFLKNFHESGYFKDRKHKAEDVISAINRLRKVKPFLSLEDEIDALLNEHAEDPDSQNDLNQNLPEEDLPF
jgi:hypothetical protein